jgi:hypothetical protein
VDEPEHLATHDGDPGEFQTPASLTNFSRRRDLRNQPLGAGMPDNSPEQSNVPIKLRTRTRRPAQVGAHEI